MNSVQPFREPIRATFMRTIGIALVAGIVFATLWRVTGSWAIRWLGASLVMLWPAAGGHWLELWFLNWLRPRVPAARSIQIAARLAVWFVGGIAIVFGMWATALGLLGGRPFSYPPWWAAGIGFIAIELLAHVALQARGRPSFFNGRG